MTLFGQGHKRLKPPLRTASLLLQHMVDELVDLYHISLRIVNRILNIINARLASRATFTIKSF